MFIPFNKPAITGKELDYISLAMHEKGISSDGVYVGKCEDWFEQHLKYNRILLTGSCTHSLEIAALLLNLQDGDEIIMPSYTFVTTANAFVLHGGTPVFVDIHEKTMNIDERLIEAAITDKTRAIIVMHYGGVACNMPPIMELAEKHNLVVIEDAAQALMSRSNGQYLGTFGHLATFSFHETKNYTSGEGGALIINDSQYIERAEIIRQKGTNRNKFIRGEVDKYSWVDIGSSYVMSELNAAYLYAQLEVAEQINLRRLNIWHQYYTAFCPLQEQDLITLPDIPDDCEHNGHLFFIKMQDIEQRSDLINYLKKHDICAVFHYIPLHDSPAGQKYARFNGRDIHTTAQSQKLLRLPLFYNMTDEEVRRVIDVIHKYFLT